MACEMHGQERFGRETYLQGGARSAGRQRISSVCDTADCSAGCVIVLFPLYFSAILSKQEISPAGGSGTCARSLRSAGFWPVQPDAHPVSGQRI